MKRAGSRRGTSVRVMISIDSPTVGCQEPAPPSWRARVWVTVPRTKALRVNATAVVRTYGIAVERAALITSSRAVSKPKMASRP